MSETMDIVATLEASGHYATFLSALKSADLTKTLQGAGPFTLFAPSDSAFEKIPEAQLNALLGGNPGQIRAVMAYHFASGKVLAARFSGKRIRATTFAGGAVVIDGRPEGLRVNGVRCVEPDLIARNGVIHGIEGVLSPKAPGVIVGAAVA